jgi:hypothetical protein
MPRDGFVMQKKPSSAASAHSHHFVEPPLSIMR